jgi:4-hydroxybenzoate polyprenyltransferase
MWHEKTKLSTLQLVIISARPNTWIRIWGEMIVAAALASYPHFDLFRFLLVFLVTSPILWTAMYMANDLTDISLDLQHPYRKTRPITTGLLSVSKAKITIVILTVCAFLISTFINFKIPFLLLALTLSQLTYILKPIRLKERPFWDIAVNGANSAVRFLLGWFSQTVSHPFYLLPLLLFVAIKLIFFVGHRSQNQNLEIKNRLKSTVTNLSKRKLRGLIVVLILQSGIFYLAILIRGIFPINSLWAVLGAIPLLIFIARKKTGAVMSQETDLTFRNALYTSYFLWANIIAWTVINQ